MTLTLGSLFDGIGGFPLAAIRQGITPLWASEIESFPIQVTKHHFPETLHMGDIIRLDGAKLRRWTLSAAAHPVRTYPWHPVPAPDWPAHGPGCSWSRSG